MNKRECVAALDGLGTDDTEQAHTEADDLLIEWLRSNGHGAIADAWHRVDERAGGFWYA